MKYIISEIIEFESDNQGNLHCLFKLEGDDKDCIRVLSTEAYYDWIIHLDENKDYYITSFEENEDEDYDMDLEFDFKSWKSDNENDEIIKDFIYSNYSLDELPDQEENF